MRHKRFNEVLPYTYYLVEKKTGVKYFGVRYANVQLGLSPDQDFGIVYFTSGRFKESFKDSPELFYFRINHTFDSKEDAVEYEAKVLKRVYKRSGWANNAVAKTINFTPEIRKKMSEVGYQYSEKFGMTVNEYRGMKIKETKENNKGAVKAAAIKASETMSNTVLPNGETLHQQRIRKGLETRSTPQEDGLTLNQKAGNKISKHLNTVTESGLTISQLKHREFIKKLVYMPEEEFYGWLNHKAVGYQKYIKNCIFTYHGIKR